MIFPQTQHRGSVVSITNISTPFKLIFVTYFVCALNANKKELVLWEPAPEYRWNYGMVKFFARTIM
jgi:hypothetical protein